LLWSNTRVAVRCGWRAYSWQYSAGEAYESIGVNGNHVVLAIGVSCRQRGVRTVTVTKTSLLTARVSAPT